VTDIIAQLLQIASDHDYDAALLIAQAWHESRMDPLAESPAGAKGLFQFMPATAEQYQVDTTDVESSALGAMRYMGYLLARFGTEAKALAAYNCGPTRLAEIVKEHGANWRLALPSETKEYLRVSDTAALLREVI